MIRSGLHARRHVRSLCGPHDVKSANLADGCNDRPTREADDGNVG